MSMCLVFKSQSGWPSSASWVCMSVMSRHWHHFLCFFLWPPDWMLPSRFRVCVLLPALLITDCFQIRSGSLQERETSPGVCRRMLEDIFSNFNYSFGTDARMAFKWRQVKPSRALLPQRRNSKIGEDGHKVHGLRSWIAHFCVSFINSVNTSNIT